MKFDHEVIEYTNELIPVHWIIFDAKVPKSTVLPHWHASVELSYTYKGAGVQFVINSKKFDVQKGTVLVMNPIEVHSVLGEQAVDIEALTIQIPYSILSKLVPKFDYQRFFTCLNALPNKENELQKIQSCLRDFYETALNYPDYLAKIKLISLSYEIIYLLTSNFMYEVTEQSLSTVKNSHMRRIENVIFYIQENYSQDLSIDKIAKENYLSSFYLSKLFTRNLGMGVMTYVQLVRVKNAQQYLLYTDKPIQVISDLVGFKNPKSFRIAFMRQFGQTPKHYQIAAKESETKGADQN